MLSVAVGISGCVYLWAATRRVRWLVYLLKPGTMALMIAMAVSGARSGSADPYAAWVVAALVASVVGDILLMLPKDRFIYGLIAFLIAHLLYIYAIWVVLPVRMVPQDILTALAVALPGALIARRIGAGLREQGQDRLLVPVMVYMTVILLMVWRALSLLFQPDALPVQAWLVAPAAVLFCVSDSILGWNRFVRPVPYRDILVMSTYFGAQYLFALSAAGISS